MSIFAPGLQRLASFNFGSAAATSGAIAITPCKILIIEYLITGYSGADVGSWRWNADATGTNYGTWWYLASNASTPLLAKQTSINGVGSVANTPVSGVTQTVGRRGCLRISNIAASRKIIDIRNSNESTTTTGPSMDFGWGEWLNTTAQITSVEFRTNGGANFNVNSGFIIYGDNY